MSKLYSLWLLSAIWVLAVCAVGVVLGISGWRGTLMFALAGAAPILIARHFWRVPEPSLSQRIQRELR